MSEDVDQRNRFMTDVYLVCYHSARPLSINGTSRQYQVVEEAIDQGEWPYDNGDDPSFYVARRGGPLTWGVCRQDLRNVIKVGSIVVFFSFTPRQRGRIVYRLCAVSTVAEKTDHRAIHRDSTFRRFRQLYINNLIRPDAAGWCYDENDRRPDQRHDDWLCRIAHHRAARKAEFDLRFAHIYRGKRFDNTDLHRGTLLLANNYVVFSTSPGETFISPQPPQVAVASAGEHESWTDRTFRAITVGRASKALESGRDYLRVANSSGRNVHRQLRFTLPSSDAASFREELIKSLRDVKPRGYGVAVRDRRRARSAC